MTAIGAEADRPLSAVGAIKVDGLHTAQILTFG